MGRCELDRIASQIGESLVLRLIRRVSDELIGNIGVNVVGQVEIVLQGTDSKSLEDPKDCLTQRIRDSVYSHATGLDCTNEGSS